MSDVQQQAGPAAGWYPDPSGAGGSRWWSGEGWTEHVQPDASAGQARSQSDWHARPVGGASVHRQAGGSVSLSTRTGSADARRHDPYRPRNWAAGFAFVLALLSIPALGWRAVAELPPVSESIFAGAPIAIALLALVLSVRRGSGTILSIVAIVIAGAVLLAGLLIDPAVLRDITGSVLALLPV